MSAETISESRGASEFWLGVKAGLPVVMAAAPFGVLFGALAVENGLSVVEATLMSATIYGGASQMVGIELFGQKVAPWLVVLSIFAVNFRHVLYSGGDRPAHRHWPVARRRSATSSWSTRNIAETERKAEAARRSVCLVHRHGAADLRALGRRDLGRRDLRQTHSRSTCARHRLPAADLFPRPGDGVPRPAAVAAGGDRQRRRLGRRLQTVGSPWHVSIGAAAGILLAAVMPPRLSANGRSQRGARSNEHDAVDHPLGRRARPI